MVDEGGVVDVTIRMAVSADADAMADVPPKIPVVLWVLEGNNRGRAFYERQGFPVDGAVTTIRLGGRDLAEVRFRLDRHDSSSQVANPSDR